MAFLCVATEDGSDFARLALDGVTHPLPLGEDARLHRRLTSSGEKWILVGPPALRINGAALDLGICVLADRDEIRLGSQRCYFLAQRGAVVEPAPVAEVELECPRCTESIESGTPSALCGCGVRMHASEERPCLSIGACPRCEAPPDAAGLRWSPEEI